MGQSPEQIRHDIERTREGMDETLGHIEDRVTPSRVLHRRTEKVRGAWGSVRDRVMGSAHDAGNQGSQLTDQASARLGQASDEASATLQRAGDQVSSTFHQATDEASQRLEQAQRAGRDQFQGNPLAAGLVAFGLGALVGSLLPETEKEHELAEQAKDRLEPVTEGVTAELKSAGQEVAEDMKQEAQQAVEETKQTVADAAETVKGDAKGAADHVRDESQDRAQQVKSEAQR